MSYRLMKTKLGDYFILLEYRKVHPITKEKCYKSKQFKFDNSEFKLQLKQYANSGEIPKKLKDYCLMVDCDFQREMNEFFKLGIDKTNTTFDEYIRHFLEFQKKNKAVTTWSRDADVAQYFVKKIGRIKVNEFNRIITQNLIDEIADMKSLKNIIKPKDDFNAKLKEAGYDYHILRQMIRNSNDIIMKNKINHSSLANVIAGDNVSEVFAKNLCNIVGLSFEDLFIKKEIVNELSYNTKKKYTQFLSKMLSQCVKEGYISDNYCSSKYITMFKDNKPNKENKCMKFEEFDLYNKKLMEPYFNYPAQIANLILAETGIRKEELCGLKWNAIDFEKCCIIIRTTITYSNKVGVVINDLRTKNSSSFRIITVSDYLIQKLKEYKNYQLEIIEAEKNVKVNTKDDNYWLFIQRKRENFGKVISPQTINIWLNEFLDYCGIQHYTVHQIRHTYISYLLDKGTLSIAEVSRRAGHSSITTTLDIYAHVMQRLEGNKDGQSYIAELLKKDEAKAEQKTNPKERLEKLKELYDSKLITKDEFIKRKQEILLEI